MIDSNYVAGWVKLYRSIQKHWLWKKPLSKFEAWVDIILSANHSQEKINLGNEIFICERGEKMYSLDTWSNRWGWHKSKVRRFLKMLETDTMIELKSNRYTTHLSICNYNTYQDMQNGDETQMKLKRNGSETQTTPIKELKNEKELKKDLKDINTKIPKTPKKKYGEYKHVLLTDEEIKKLEEKLNGNSDHWIKTMDEAIEMKGYKYKSHYLAILKWYEKDRKSDNRKQYQKNDGGDFEIIQ